MPLTRVKSPGWAAFDLKKQQQGLVPKTEEDSYPPIPSTLASLREYKNVTRSNDILVRPFSSVVDDYDSKGKHEHKAIEENNYELAIKKLKALHNWADSNVIEDVMEAVDNNVWQALNLLKGMISSSSPEESKDRKITKLSSTIDDSFTCGKSGEKCCSKKRLCLSNLSSTTGNVFEDNFVDLQASSIRNISNNADDMKSIMERLSSLPMEPEWEEDDVYLVHRKDAIKMIRSACQHSKAAENAFLRDDHCSAQQHSLKARQAWLMAESLNSKAAKEILSIRNSENDLWKLDLHGLHAAEAVQALQERLQKIEVPMPMNRSVSSNRMKPNNGMVLTPSLATFSCMDMKIVDKQQSSLRQIQKTLQIITGVGNHSRGQAALPTAVRSFLSENRYRFDETRPGVIMVRPKFRHR